ncbi:hypothetical protein [Leptospira sp. GIMC2001]|uniref:hypothetical protein n=1 Tax=Leptospira sp. GIMC2001 TaxID=1513297 RepID=UPI002348F4BC|nr:hypothetical protein [Leptospira sp. GIMC2001]WCL51159.1 hypothetical protein O4O04_10200 [Leptospira sp. GIMC2001]
MKAIQSGSRLKVSGEDGTMADSFTGAAEIHDWIISYDSKDGVFIGELTWGNLEHGASYGQKGSFRWNQSDFKTRLLLSLNASKREGNAKRNFHWSLIH